MKDYSTAKPIIDKLRSPLNHLAQQLEWFCFSDVGVIVGINQGLANVQSYSPTRQIYEGVEILQVSNIRSNVVGSKCLVVYPRYNDSADSIPYLGSRPYCIPVGVDDPDITMFTDGQSLKLGSCMFTGDSFNLGGVWYADDTGSGQSVYGTAAAISEVYELTGYWVKEVADTTNMLLQYNSFDADGFTDRYWGLAKPVANVDPKTQKYKLVIENTKDGWTATVGANLAVISLSYADGSMSVAVGSKTSIAFDGSKILVTGTSGTLEID